MPVISAETVLVTGGETESSVIDLGSRVLRGVVFPEGWDSGDDPATFEMGVPNGATGEIEFCAVDGLSVSQAPAQVSRVTIPFPGAQEVLGQTKLVVNAQEAGEPAVLVVTFSSYDFSTDHLSFTLQTSDNVQVPVSLTTDLVDGDGFTNALQEAANAAGGDEDALNLGWVVDGDTITFTTDVPGASIIISDVVDDGPNTDLTDSFIVGTDIPDAILLLTEERY